MKIIYNHLLPFPGFTAMMFFGVIFARKKHHPLSKYLINHEMIHLAQARECGGFFVFYIKYLAYWVKYGYKRIPFETEAYNNDWNLEYLSSREPFAWRKWLSAKKHDKTSNRNDNNP